MPPATLTPRRGFSAEEYTRRREQLQKGMAAAGIDIALFTTAAEFHYCCGFQTPFWHSPTRPWFLLLPAAGKPTAVIPSIGAALMQQCEVADIRTWSSPHPSDDGVSLLADTIRTMHGNSEHITLGTMRGRQSTLRMPPADFDRLRAALPSMQVQDITPLVQQTRMIKSTAEIEKIAAACDRAGSAFDHWHEWLHPGISARDIFREFKIHCLRAGVDDVVYLSGGIGRGGYADVISPPTDAALTDGDVLMLDTGCTFDGYFCDFDRNIGCGNVDDAAMRCHETLWHATEAAIATATASATCRDLFHTMHSIIADAGYASCADSGGADVGRYGHGLGIELTETPSITAWDDTPLAAGMVLTLEPSATLPDGKLLVHEENIVITCSGKPQLLTRRAPRNLPLLPLVK